MSEDTAKSSSMSARDSAALLRLYAESRSEEAFAVFVERYVDFVYSAAVRCVAGDAHMAKDVVQEVFVVVARRATLLAQHSALEAWLHTTTRYEANHAVRREQRRRIREQKAHTMNELNFDSTDKTEWHQLRPLLDDALGKLNEQDREAVVMRFFLRCSLSEIGAKFRLSEDTARRRVDRALGKLHRLLAQRGIVSTTTAVAGILSAQAVTAAPTGMAAVVTSAAVGASAGATSTTFSILYLMNTSKFVTSVGVTLIIAAAGTAIYEASARRDTAVALTATDQQIEASQHQLAGLAEQVKTSEAERTRIGNSMEAARAKGPAAVPASPQPVSASVKSTSSKTQEMIAGDEFLSEHPEAQKLWDAREKATLAGKMAPFYRRLGLSAVQIDAFEELVLQNQTRNTGINSPDGPLVLHADPKLSPEEFESRARALLGNSGWDEIQQFARLAPAYDLTAKLASAVYRSDPLSSDQIDGVALILANASPQFQQGRVVNRTTIDWNAALVQAQSVLSPSQLAAFADLQRQNDYQLAAQKLLAP